MLQITTVPVLEKVDVPVDPKKGTATLAFTFKVTESDTALQNRAITGTVTWGNGSAPASFSGSGSSGVTRTFSVIYKPGVYQIRISAQNKRSPNPDIADYFIVVTVTAKKAEPKRPSILYGPILPKDSGYPNDEQWKLNAGTDIEIIESSIKMLLITSPGDRIMQPDYGTNLRRLLFEHDVSIAETLAKEDISFAMSKWEPRARLLSLAVTREQNKRQAQISAIFESFVHQSQIPVDLTITP